MKNTYLFSYLPIISILLFSLSFAIYGLKPASSWRYLSYLLLLFCMVFAALKLISDTILELSLLFFSRDSEGKALNSVRKGSVIYVIGGACSLFSVQFIFGLGSVFIATNVVALIYFF
ncbi:DUF5366 family protein [Peribacillus frigoritolerans]|uniref:DUF5366 family protein n=1 Tax=Peribacillus frigoritolerans TaxID=450367 RepID=UPI001070BED7|nr:DUF5366 family protein [Peribacillus frigoritolerans]TFH61585.1 hypothetical protein E4J71_09050 [Peribacillus frigoritolerans]